MSEGWQFTLHLTEMASNVAVLVAAIVAVAGINSWRSQLRGTKRYELSEEVLALFYQMRDAFHDIRIGLVWKGEGESRERRPGESDAERRAKERAHVVVERFDKHGELFARLNAVRYRFRAQFGCSRPDPFDDLGSLLKKLMLAAREYGRLAAIDESALSEEKREAHVKLLAKHESVIDSSLHEADEFGAKIDALVARMEEICRPIIQG